mmetsp:Transcript_7756/g.19007  ORF Transcript_7756/g.19007 Transcript_7756/m.19007 type:complete len:286 (+) Transcript_7756:238-1095(+)
MTLFQQFRRAKGNSRFEQASRGLQIETNLFGWWFYRIMLHLDALGLAKGDFQKLGFFAGKFVIGGSFVGFLLKGFQTIPTTIDQVIGPAFIAPSRFFVVLHKIQRNFCHVKTRIAVAFVDLFFGGRCAACIGILRYGICGSRIITGVNPTNGFSTVAGYQKEVSLGPVGHFGSAFFFVARTNDSFSNPLESAALTSKLFDPHDPVAASKLYQGFRVFWHVHAPYADLTISSEQASLLGSLDRTGLPALELSLIDNLSNSERNVFAIFTITLVAEELSGPRKCHGL